MNRSSIFCSRFDFLGNLFRPTGLYGPNSPTLKSRVLEVPLEARLLIILSLQYLLYPIPRSNNQNTLFLFL